MAFCRIARAVKGLRMGPGTPSRIEMPLVNPACLRPNELYSLDCGTAARLCQKQVATMEFIMFFMNLNLFPLEAEGGVWALTHSCPACSGTCGNL
jgi:hypothetical protein